MPENHPILCMKTTQHLQKISTGISLVVLALGFSLIGLTSVLHPLHSGDAPDFNGTSCALGGTAGLAAGTIFFVAAFLYWRRQWETNGSRADSRSATFFELAPSIEVALCHPRSAPTGTGHW